MIFAGGRFIHRKLRMNAINFDELIKGLVDDGFTGYVSLKGENNDFKLIFDSGAFLGATSNGVPMAGGSEANRGLPRHNGSGVIDVVEIPARLIRMIWGVSIGEDLTGKIPTDIVDLKGFMSKHKGRFASGALVLYKDGIPRAFISIDKDKWLFVTSKEEFLKLYEEEGVTLALFSFDHIKPPKNAADLQDVIRSLVDPASYGRDLLIRKLKEYFPQCDQSLVHMVEREFKGLQDLEPVLAKIEEYIRLFVDGSIDKGVINAVRDAFNREIKK